jgi:uncharacterized protein (DUF1778 family)
VPHSTRTIIERAAAIYGATISQFIVQASVDRANEVLHRLTVIHNQPDTGICLDFRWLCSSGDFFS